MPLLEVQILKTFWPHNAIPNERFSFAGEVRELLDACLSQVQ